MNPLSNAYRLACPSDGNSPYSNRSFSSLAARAVGIVVFTAAVQAMPVAADVLPTVSIAATDANAAESSSPNTGAFRIERTGDTTSALMVNFISSGTASAADYTPAIGTSAEIPAGSAFVDVIITPTDDILLEGDEALTLTLASDAAYTLGTGVATITIADNETVIDLSRYVRVGRYDLPEPTRSAHPVNSLLAQEASNVTYNWDTDTLFMTGDGGTSVVQVSKTGQLINSMTIATGTDSQGGNSQGTAFYDTEGLTYVGGGQFVLMEERYREANLFTYSAGGTLGLANVQRVKLGTTVGNVGIEGLCYDPLTSGFICVKEKTPQSIFQTGINFGAGTATNGSPTTVNSTDLFNPSLAGLLDFSDVFALSNLPALAGKSTNSHLLVISQESGQIVHIDRSGTISSALTIVADPGSPLSVPDMTMEGVTMDRNGVLYITNENGGGDANHPQLWVYAPSNASNLAPTAVALNNPVNSIPENTSTAGGVKVADINISDDGLGVNTVTLSGADASFFQVTGTALFLKSGTVLNSTSKPNYNVTVNVDDVTAGSTPDATVNFTLTITASTGGTGQLVISEVAPWSSGSGGPSSGVNFLRVDWFEVTNIGTAAVNLTGWKMDDNSNSFGSAAPLAGITSIAPGESVIFIETADTAPATLTTKSAAFRSLWFGANPPANLQIGGYSGSGVGLSTTTDAVNLFNSAGAVQARVDFGASPAGPSFPTFDNAAGLNGAVTISNLAVVGVNGAFAAVNDANEKGSPGTIGAPATPIITILATDANAAEAGTDPGTFRISRSGSTVGLLTVNYTIATGSGQAANGTDYTPALTGVATIPSGQSFVDVTITPVNDTLIELSETATLTLGDTGSYDVGSPATATVTIADNDSATGLTLTSGTLDISTVTGLPSGGTLTGPGVTGSTFNSAGLGSGVKTLNYSFTDGSGTRTVSFNITLQSVTFTGVASGDASDSEAIIWTRAVDGSTPTVATTLTAQISTSPSFTSPITATAATFPTADFTLKFAVPGLASGTQYYYRFIGPAGETSLVGKFKTAPAANASAPLHFAFSGDNDGLMRPYALASVFPSLNLDFYINLGDVIYENASNVAGNNGAPWLNSPSVTLSNDSLSFNGIPRAFIPAGTPFATSAQLKADYEKKYRENFLPVNTGGQNSLQVLYASQGNYTTWDNHEMGNRKYIDGGAPAGGSVGGPSGTDMLTGRGVDARNNGAGNVGNINDVNTSTTDFMNRSTGFVTLENVFISYMAIANRGLVNAPSDPRSHGTPVLYSAQQWGKNAIYINTDSRTYRDLRLKTANAGADETTAPRANNPARTMLGATQLAWLKQKLLDAQNAGTPWKFVSLSDAIDQIGPIGGSLAGVTATTMQPFSGNSAYGPVSADGGKTHQGGYRAERNALLKFIADNHITNVVILSCDDHQNRINELAYSPTGQTEVQSSYVKVPYCFSIVCGPLGATGPDLFVKHAYTDIQGGANLIANAQSAAGIEPIGLAANYPGLSNVMRDKGTGLVLETNPQPASFYSPDTFNATVFDVSANGKTLTVSSLGMNSTAQNSATEYANGPQARTVFSFQVDSAIDALATVPEGVTVNRGGIALDRRTGKFVQAVTLTNTSATPVSGTVALALENLSANATLVNSTGSTANPLAVVDVGADNILSPGESATVTLQFNNPTRAGINYTPRVLGGIAP